MTTILYDIFRSISIVFAKYPEFIGGDITEKSTLFDRIFEMAKEKGMSINQLEEKAKLSKGSTYKWNVVSPSIKNLKKVADVLECTVNDLIE